MDKVQKPSISECNIVVIQKQLTVIASLNNKMSGRSASVIDSTHCSNKAIVCHGIMTIPVKFLTVLTDRLQ
jgi:hypothetical protein